MSSDSKSDLPKVEVSFPDQNFEGPLDLLLSLIQKHELDILNIPIAFVTEKYLEFIRVMQLMNLDLASEYLVMAATLAHIKSKMLLPQVPDDQEGEALAEDEEDPRKALIRRLLEYQKYKQAAAELRERSTFGQDSFLRGAPLHDAVDPGLPPLAKVPLFSLVEAFQRVLDQTRVKITHDVVADRVSLSDRINQLVDFLRDRKHCTFEELFVGVVTREGLVITFLALLEMAKLRLARLYQTESLGAIMVELADGAESPFSTTEQHLAQPKAEGAEDGVESPTAEGGEVSEEAQRSEEAPAEPPPSEKLVDQDGNEFDLGKDATEPEGEQAELADARESAAEPEGGAAREQAELADATEPEPPALQAEAEPAFDHTAETEPTEAEPLAEQPAPAPEPVPAEPAEPAPEPEAAEPAPEPTPEAPVSQADPLLDAPSSEEAEAVAAATPPDGSSAFETHAFATPDALEQTADPAPPASTPAAAETPAEAAAPRSAPAGEPDGVDESETMREIPSPVDPEHGSHPQGAAEPWTSADAETEDGS